MIFCEGKYRDLRMKRGIEDEKIFVVMALESGGALTYITCTVLYTSYMIFFHLNNFS